MTTSPDTLDLFVNLSKPSRSALIISATNNNIQQNLSLILNDMVGVRVFFYNQETDGSLTNAQLDSGRYVSVGGGKTSAPGAELMRVDDLTENNDGTYYWYEGLMNLGEAVLRSAIGDSPTLVITLQVQVQDDTHDGSPTYRKTLAHSAVTVLNDYVPNPSGMTPTLLTPTQSIDWTATGTTTLSISDPCYLLDVILYFNDDVVGLDFDIGSTASPTALLEEGSGVDSEVIVYEFNQVWTGGEVVITVNVGADLSSAGKVVVRSLDLS